MNPAQLLEHFDRISEALDAVARLRRFIVDLAVRGKLVEQDPNDEPAAELLKRIQSEKVRLVKEGAAKKEKPLHAIEEEEKPFSVPASWRWVRLQDIASYIQRGKSPIYAAEDGLPVVSQKCIQWTGLDLAASRLITKASITRYEEVRFLRENDLLWNSTGTGTIGRVVRVVAPPAQLVCDSHVTVVRCTLANAEYVRSWLSSDHVYRLIEDRAAGSTNQVELTAHMAMAQVVPLPPLAEQHRIVAKVNELMALCDQLEAAKNEREARRDWLVSASLRRIGTAPAAAHEDATEAQSATPLRDAARFHLEYLPRLTTRPEHIKQLRQTIRNLAVQGRLAPQDPNDEPGLELLKRIAEERAELVRIGRIRKERSFSPVADEDVPFVLPKSWVWTKIGDAALFTEYGTSQQSSHSDSGVPVLKMGDIQDGRVLLGGQKKVPATIDELPALYLENHDLLYNRTNSAELVGKTGIYIGSDNKYTFASYLIRIRCSRISTNPVYFNMAMNAPWFRETQITPHLKQQCGQANVNGTILKNMLIPLPPLAEQHHIVAKVDELMALCDQLEAGLVATQENSRRLLEAVLHEALAPAMEQAA